MENHPPKSPSASDLQALQSIQAAGSRMALMPVIFNGEPRMGLVLLLVNSTGPYVQVVAVLPTPGDAILNAEGKPASTSPPVPKSQLN